MTTEELIYLHALNLVPGVGSQTLRTIGNYFPSYKNAWSAGAAELEHSGIMPHAVAAIVQYRATIKPEEEHKKVMDSGVWMLTDGDTHYPKLLGEVHQRPMLLYGRGNTFDKYDAPAIGIVGTRRPTAYGKEVCEAITSVLAQSGMMIVSGLASGIDAIAHRTALEARGATIAVLGSGLDRQSIFPPENRNLADKIAAENGTIISEYPPGTPALKEHFPQRNRIISGISRGVVVVEARERSGALITARFALEQNREVFAIPGSIFSMTSAGANKLIQEGAKLVACAEDILEELGLAVAHEDPATNAPNNLTPNEQVLWTLLDEPLSIDVIKERSMLETSVIVASLSLLELKGLVRQLGADTYQRI